MKRFLLYLLVASVFFSCDDDKEILDVTMKGESISFEPIFGGATMKYDLSDISTDVYYIKAEYFDRNGKNCIVKGSYLSKQMDLMGFVEEAKNVPVKITLLNQNNVESEVLELKFDTKECVAQSVANSVQAHPYWSGFYVDYEAEDKGGFIHVAKVGIDPFTKVVDTLLLSTEAIRPSEEGKKNKLLFSDVCDIKTNLTDVVVWTEDLKGNILKKKQFPKIKAVMAGIIDPGYNEEDNTLNFDFIGSSYENEGKKLSWKYLFDGDTKGYKHILNGGNNYYRYRSETKALKYDNRFVIDLKEPKNLAKIRLYSGLRSAVNFESSLFDSHPEGMTPCHVVIYGANELKTKMNGPFKVTDWEATQTTKLAEYQEDAFAPLSEKWHYPFCTKLTQNTDAAGILKADPCFLQLKFVISENTYRYVVMQVLENSCDVDDGYLVDRPKTDDMIT